MRAAQKGVVHQNTASRKVSRLTKQHREARQVEPATIEYELFAKSASACSLKASLRQCWPIAGPLSC